MAAESVQGTYTESRVQLNYPKFPLHVEYLQAINKITATTLEQWALVQDFFGFKFMGEAEAIVVPKKKVLVKFILRSLPSGSRRDAEKVLAQISMQVDINDERKFYDEGRRFALSVGDTREKTAVLRMKEVLPAPKLCSLHMNVRITLFGPADYLGNGIATPTPHAPFVKHLIAPENADVTIICEGQNFPVNSSILKCMSPVLSCMLDSSMEEGITRTISIEDVGAGAVGAMLDFMCKGSLPSSTTDEALVLELLHCAEKYDILELKHEVLSLMHSTMTIGNTVRFTAAALRYQADDVWRDKFIISFKQNYNDIPKDDEFKNLLRNHVDVLF